MAENAPFKERGKRVTITTPRWIGKEGWRAMITRSRNPNTAREESRERFRRLAEQWKEQSRFLSNVAQIAMLKPYQRIIGMGWDAVPLILEELQREPRQWFWALEAITETDPVPPEAAGKVRVMAQAWIDWGKQQGFLSS
jgi:hypothetical protein